MTWPSGGVVRKSSIRKLPTVTISRLLSTRNILIEIEIEKGLVYLIFLISFIACRTCSPCYLALQVHFAVLAWKAQKEKTKQKTRLAPTRYWQAVKQVYFIFRGERDVSRKKKKKTARGCGRGWEPSYPLYFFPALLLRAALHYPNAWNGLCQHRPRGVGLLKSHYGSWSARRQQQEVTLRVCASRWTEVWGSIGSQRMQQRTMAPVLKNFIVLVICSIFVECWKDKVFCVICEIGLKANKSQIIHNFARFVVNEWYCFVFWLARSRQAYMGFCVTNSCKTPLLKYWVTGKKSLHVSCDRVQNVYAWGEFE